MRVAIHIPVWKRLRLTAVVYRGIERLISVGAEIGVSIEPVIIYSEEDHRILAQANGWSRLPADNFPVSEKHNLGMKRICQILQPDYVLQMNSDTLISSEGLRLIIEEMRSGTLFFGFQKLLVAHAIKREMKIYNYTPSSHIVLGAGRCFSSDLLQKFAPDYHLWNKEQNSGLDKLSQKAILDKCLVVPKVLKPDQPVIMDVKGFESISNYDDWQGQIIPWNDSFSPEVPLIKELTQ